MPNWSFNKYAVKAQTKNVLDFVNEGLKNLGREPKENIKDAIEDLWKDNNVTMATFRPIPETFLKYDTTNKKMDRNDIDYKTKEPLFKTDEKYETYCKEYDGAVKYQKETYGVVGWYDYNLCIGFGCKWNTEVELESYDIDETSDTTTIFMKGDTPWCYPDHWLYFIKKTFDVHIFLCSHEEQGAYNFFAEIGVGDIKEYDDPESLDNAPKEEDFEEYIDYYHAITELRYALEYELDCDYLEYVKNYNVQGNETQNEDESESAA